MKSIWEFAEARRNRGLNVDDLVSRSLGQFAVSSRTSKRACRM